MEDQTFDRLPPRPPASTAEDVGDAIEGCDEARGDGRDAVSEVSEASALEQMTFAVECAGSGVSDLLRVLGVKKKCRVVGGGGNLHGVQDASNGGEDGMEEVGNGRDDGA